MDGVAPGLSQPERARQRKKATEDGQKQLLLRSYNCARLRKRAMGAACLLSRENQFRLVFPVARWFVCFHAVPAVI